MCVRSRLSMLAKSYIILLSALYSHESHLHRTNGAKLLSEANSLGFSSSVLLKIWRKNKLSEWALVQTKPHVSSSPVSVKSQKVMERERKHLVAWLRRNPHRKGAAMDQHTPVPSRSHIKTPLACLLRSFWGLQLSKYATVLNFWLARCCTGSGCWRSKKERKLIFFFREPD